VSFLSLVTWWVVGDDPPRGGVWGTVVPHRAAGVGQRWVGGRIFGNASASREWAECLQLPNSYACMTGLFRAAQDDL